MIIECKNCSKQFNVSDSDIPKKGRLVQCGNCSTQWFYMPFQTSVEDIDTTKDAYTSPREIIASDGKSYKFLGNQWAELLPSGKTGRLAKKIIARELDKFAGIKKKETTKKKIYNGANTQDKDLIKADIEGIKTDSEGMGIFSMLLVFILFAASVILFLDTFKFWLIPIWPKLENHLVYVFETVNNIYIVIKYFFLSYK